MNAIKNKFEKFLEAIAKKLQGEEVATPTPDNTVEALLKEIAANTPAATVEHLYKHNVKFNALDETEFAINFSDGDKLGFTDGTNSFFFYSTKATPLTAENIGDFLADDNYFGFVTNYGVGVISNSGETETDTYINGELNISFGLVEGDPIGTVIAIKRDSSSAGFSKEVYNFDATGVDITDNVVEI